MNVYRQDCSKFEQSEKVALRCAALDLYQTMMNTRAPDGAKKQCHFHSGREIRGGG